MVGVRLLGEEMMEHSDDAVLAVSVLDRSPAMPHVGKSSGFTAYKCRRVGNNWRYDTPVMGLTLADLQDTSRFPQGQLTDEAGEFVWGCGLKMPANEGGV